jgi:hypothetical protein
MAALDRPSMLAHARALGTANGSATPLSYALTEAKCRSFCIQINGNSA